LDIDDVSMMTVNLSINSFFSLIGLVIYLLEIMLIFKILRESTHSFIYPSITCRCCREREHTQFSVVSYLKLEFKFQITIL